ncbi:hypothetical protein [Halodesulfovibrio aestuarii]|uniref:hypothetical protein n=1 Tax=Halodesulfovibrio aestuarii TaxID=126333 RepID=UPI003D341387
MKRYYDPESGGFFISTIHNDIPKQAVLITLEEHTALLEALSQGKQIKVDENGYPIAVNPSSPPESPEPTYDELRQAAILEKWPMPSQLEALTEAAESPERPEKLNALLAYVQEIKAKYPKPEGE